MYHMENHNLGPFWYSCGWMDTPWFAPFWGGGFWYRQAIERFAGPKTLSYFCPLGEHRTNPRRYLEIPRFGHRPAMFVSCPSVGAEEWSCSSCCFSPGSMRPSGASFGARRISKRRTDRTPPWPPISTRTRARVSRRAAASKRDAHQTMLTSHHAQCPATKRETDEDRLQGSVLEASK